MKRAGFALLFVASLSQFSQSARGDTSGQAPSLPHAPEQEEGWRALPAGRAFGVIPSDPRDLKLGLRLNNKSEFEADVGAYRSIAGWRGGDWLFHTGIEGAAFFQMRKEGSAFPLHSSDGLIGWYAEAAQNTWAYQFRYTHISAHLSDGIAHLRQRFLYTREFFQLRVAKEWAWVRAYAGYYFLTHTDPKLPKHMLQLGAYAYLPWSFGRVHPYLGADARIRNAQEGSTMQLSLGGAWMSSSPQVPPLRLTASYLKGHDLRGQFYLEPTEKWIFGLDLDL